MPRHPGWVDKLASVASDRPDAVDGMTLVCRCRLCGSAVLGMDLQRGLREHV